MPGILTGVILTISRAAGETAPILFTRVTFYINGVTTSINQEFMALPYHLYMLSAHNSNLYFGDKQVLKNINIDFPKNQVTSPIGPSGCGKSTLLRSFNRMHDLSADARVEGLLKIDHLDIYDKKNSVTEIRKRIGMVFQKPNPLPKSIYENLAYTLRIHNFPKNEIPVLIENALKESYLREEVKDEFKKPAVKLSGGQQQRLCISRKVVLRPEIILMH